MKIVPEDGYLILQHGLVKLDELEALLLAGVCQMPGGKAKNADDEYFRCEGSLLSKGLVRKLPGQGEGLFITQAGLAAIAANDYEIP